MSEFIAQGKVSVRADTTLFREQLLKELNRASKQQVVVKVIPTTVGFAGELRKQLAKLRIPPVAVSVVPSATGFRTALAELVTTSSTGIKARIGMVPDPKGFRAALAAAAAKSATGVVAPVAIAAQAARTTRAIAPADVGVPAANEAEAAAVTKATGAITKKTTATAAGTKAEQEFARATALDALAQEDLTAALGATEGLRAQQTREAVAFRAAVAASKTALLEENAALLASSEALRVSIAERQAVTASALAQAESTAAAASIGVVDPARAAAAVAAERAIVTAQGQRLRSETELLTVEQRAAAAALAVTSAEEARIAATISGSGALIDRAAAEVKAANAANANLAPAAAALASEREIARVRKELATAAGLTIKSETDVGTARSRHAIAAKALTAAQANLNTVTGLGIVQAERHALTLFEEAVAAEADAAALLEAAGAEKVLRSEQRKSDLEEERRLRRRQTRTSQATRGFASTGLAAAGARGATLAASGPFLAGAVSAVTVGVAIKQVADLEKQLNVFRVTAEATADETRAVGEEARKLGRDMTLPATTSKSAAQTMTELAKAGLSVQDSMDGARGALQLATAAEIDTVRATELVASALNSFGLSGKSAVAVADLLANASIQAQGSIEDMGIALQQSAAVGRQVGLSLDDTVSLLTLLAKNGLQGSDAGTSLRTALLRLSSPTEKAEKALKKLGVTLFDASGALRPEAFAELGVELDKLSRREEAIATRDIFGQDAIRAFTIIAREGVKGLEAIQAGNARAGAAAKLASAQTKGLAGSMENLKNQAAAAAFELGQDLAPKAEKLVNAFAGAFGAIAGFLGGNQDPFGAASQSLDTLLEKSRGFEALKLAPGVSEFETGAATAGLAALEKQLKNVGQRLVREGRLDVFFDAFKKGSEEVRKAMEDNVITPSEKAALSASGVGRAFLSALPDRFFVGLEAGVRSAIEDAVAAAKVGVEDLGVEVRSGIEDASRGAVVAAREAGTKVGQTMAEALAAQAAKVNAAANKLVIGLGNQITQLSDDLNKQILAGSRQGQTDVLRDMFDANARIIAVETARLARLRKAGKVSGQATARGRIREARADQVSIQGQIDSIKGEVKADAKKAADEITKARTEADQEVLDAFAAPRARISDAQARAASTERVEDDIKFQKQYIAEIKREQDVVALTVKDIKTRTEKLRQLGSELNTEKLKLDELRKQRRETAETIAKEKLELRISLAESSGNIGLLLKLLDREIADTTKAINKARDGSQKQLELQAILSELQQRRDDVVETVFDKRLRLAELRGRKSVMLSLIDARLAGLRKELAQAKKMKKPMLDLELEIAELIQRRKDILDDAKEETKKGTTAFDLLQQFSERFNQSAGNLINADQPFVGPTGFVADISQFLKATKKTPGVSLPGGGIDQRTRVENELIAAIRENTEAVRGTTGNATTGTGTTVVRNVPPRTARNRNFEESHWAREVREG